MALVATLQVACIIYNNRYFMIVFVSDESSLFLDLYTILPRFISINVYTCVYTYICLYIDLLTYIYTCMHAFATRDEMIHKTSTEFQKFEKERLEKINIGLRRFCEFEKRSF